MMMMMSDWKTVVCLQQREQERALHKMGLEGEQTTENLSGYSKESCISGRCNRKTLKGSGQQHYMIRYEFQKDHSFHCLQNESKRVQVDADKQGKETTAMVQVKDNGGSGLESWGRQERK